MKRKNPGGRGKADTLRNEAVVILRRIDPKKFTVQGLADIFDRSHVRILQIIKENDDVRLSTG